jgi:dTDP-4-amino-4,6-dideoxygalactose transaminase
MERKNIQVTKPYLPSKEKFKKYVDRIYESEWLTNNGPLVKELEVRLADYLGVKHVVVVANGSLALQVAYKALELEGEVITTPFSFAATASTLVWEGLKPVFSDIDEKTFNLDPQLIEDKITPNTSAIVPVHVFGNPCDVDRIQEIAGKHNLRVIYDAAHAFGVQYKGESVLKYGDISTLSFHATKLFHSIEGGAIITESDEIASKVRKLINFGITGPGVIDGLGTNAKMNEFEAAMGLCVLDDIDHLISSRKELVEKYHHKLGGLLKIQNTISSNYSYMPVVFKDIEHLNFAVKMLNEKGIYPRQYFYPSLDTVEEFGGSSECLISIDISSKILCLPLFSFMDVGLVEDISDILISSKEYDNE